MEWLGDAILASQGVLYESLAYRELVFRIWTRRFVICGSGS